MPTTSIWPGHIEYFILVHDDTTQPVFDALRRARERGVTIRVLSDHMAQFAYPNRKETVKMLTDMGAQYLLPDAADPAL